MKRFFTRFLPAAFLSFTALFFSSMEVYLRNIAEFTFPATHVWKIMLLLTLVFPLFYAFLSGFLPYKAEQTVSSVFTAVGLALYIQGMFLNGHLQELNGENTVFSSRTISGNAFLWLILLCVFLFLFFMIRRKAGHEKLTEILMLTCAGLILIQGAGLFSTAVSVSPEDSEKDFYLSTDREFELSSEKNVLFFILDNCDSFIVNDALKEDPALFDELDGFTYYPNMTSEYSRTYPAVPYLLTGEKCYFDKPYTQYIQDAYESSTFLDEMHDSGTDIRIYTALNYLSSEEYSMVDNVSSYDSDSLSVISAKDLIKAMIRLGSYRSMPYFLKGFFSYTIDPINRNVLSGMPENYFTLTNNDFDYHIRLGTKGITSTDDYRSAFRFYHLFGPHPGCYMNEYGGFDRNATQSQALRGDIRMLREFFEGMKQNGTYDCSTIIITADHGNQNESEDFLLHNPACCILLVKPSGNSEEPFSVSNAPVCHNDLFAVVKSGLGLPLAEGEIPVWDIPENTDRERYYYHTAQVSATDGEVALREYRVTGDATDFSGWELTGNDRDIVYSANSVSKRRLSTD